MKPASKKYVESCPQCGQGYPIVQAFHEDKKIILVCSHCGIKGERRAEEKK